MMKLVKRLIVPSLLVCMLLVLAACGGDPAGQTAGQAAVQTLPTPQGRILTANQAANTISIIDVATDTAYGSVGTGQSPHHVVATPDGKEFWVSLYDENRVQAFDATTLKESGSVDVGAVNDDLTFDPSGKMLYVSLGKNDAVAVVDAVNKKLLQTVPVGKVPHGVKVSPDGKWLVATNTADNTVSVLSLQPDARVASTIKTGANPFEVVIANDSNTAYVSNFLGDSISVVDIKAGKTTAYIKSGQQPAMISLVQGSDGPGKLWIANTGSAEVWLVDAATRKLITRVPAGKGTHGTALTPSGKLYVTNSTDNSVTVIDTATQKAITTIPVGTNPNGLTYIGAANIGAAK